MDRVSILCGGVCCSALEKSRKLDELSPAMRTLILFLRLLLRSVSEATHGYDVAGGRG